MSIWLYCDNLIVLDIFVFLLIIIFENKVYFKFGFIYFDRSVFVLLLDVLKDLYYYKKIEYWIYDFGIYWFFFIRCLRKFIV